MKSFKRLMKIYFELVISVFWDMFPIIEYLIKICIKFYTFIFKLFFGALAGVISLILNPIKVKVMMYKERKGED